jgi:hypothetical protein
MSDPAAWLRAARGWLHGRRLVGSVDADAAATPAATARCCFRARKGAARPAVAPDDDCTPCYNSAPDPVLVGEGTFACAMLNALPCEGENPFEGFPGMVGKVMREHHAKQEAATYEAVARVPGYKEFTLPLLRACKLPNWAQLTALAKCSKFSVMDVDDADLWQLVMPDGGARFSDMVKPGALQRFGRSRMNLLHGVADLARHMATMHAHGVAHFDVKGDNVLYRPPDNRLFLIDFGLADDDAVVAALHPDIPSYATYEVYPADLKLLRLVLHTARGVSPAGARALHAAAAAPGDAEWARVFATHFGAAVASAHADALTSFKALTRNRGALVARAMGVDFQPFTEDAAVAALSANARAMYAAAAPPYSAHALSETLRSRRVMLDIRRQADVYGVALLLMAVLGYAAPGELSARVQAGLRLIVRDACNPDRGSRIDMTALSALLDEVVDGEPGRRAAPAGAGGGAGRRSRASRRSRRSLGGHRTPAVKRSRRRG